MKEQILKLAKMKDEASFYRAFPTEEAFMAKYGKKLQKLKLSENIKKADWGMSVLNNVSQLQQQYNDSPQNQWNNAVDNYAYKSPYAYEAPKSTNTNGFTTNSNPPVRDNKYTQNLSNELNPNNVKTKNSFNISGSDILQGVSAFSNALQKTGDDNSPSTAQSLVGEFGPWGEAISNVSQTVTNITDNSDNAFVYTAGKAIFDPASAWSNEDLSVTDRILGGINPIYGGFKAFEEEQRKKDQKNQLQKLYRDAQASKDVDFNHMNQQMKWRPEDNTVSPGELYPQYFAKDGGKIKSMQPERFIQDIDYELVPITPNNIYNPELSFNRRGTTFRNEANEIDNQLTLLSQKKRLTNKDKAKLIELEDNKRLLFEYQESPDTKKFKHGGNLPMGGDLQLYDGNAEVMSNNPYSPEEGQTIMLKGPSHAKGGMNISYGGNPVEAEGGEPVMKGQDGDLTIFGNMKINKEIAPLLGDKRAKGRKFKNFIADLSREEEKHNKLKDKSVMSISNLKVETPLDKLKENSFKYNAIGADNKLQEIAELKQKTASLQTAILNEAEERGIDPYKLSEGKIKKAKMGTNIPKAYNGYDAEGLETLNKEEYDYLSNLYRLAANGNPKIVKNFQEEFHRIAPKRAQTVLSKYDVTNFGKAKGMTNEQLQSNEDGLFGKRTAQYIGLMGDDNTTLDKLKEIQYTPQQKATTVSQISTDPQEKDNKLLWMNLMNSALPYFRPTDAEELDPRQLTGEMYALSTNQLEPVQAQKYHPELSSPYEVSLQDSINEITADKRSAERMMGYNPAAQAYIASQAYGAKSKVLADEFRLNQEMKNKVFSENRNILNQAQLQNLQISDNQYVRQAQAKSNTKATTQAALNSIAAKYQQNELERKTLQTYENTYNYRYGKNMRMQNWNGPALFTEPTVGSTTAGRYGETPPAGYEYIYDQNQQPIDIRKSPKTKERNGGIVKSFRDL